MPVGRFPKSKSLGGNRVILVVRWNQMQSQLVILIEHHQEVVSPYFGGVIVRFEYFETVSIPSHLLLTERTEQLASVLNQSGLGACESITLDTPTRIDFLVTLRNTNYGRTVLDDWLAKSGLAISNPIKPVRWSEFLCNEYFENGWWDKYRYEGIANGFSAVSDKTGIYEDSQNDFLAIGSPGIDGAMFGYRRNTPGLWVCYPGEDYFREMADTLDGLQDGWANGTIAV